MERTPGQAMVKDQALVEERRRQIVAHAMGLFIEYGFHGTTTRQICERASIPAGTLYLYLRKKEDVLYYAAVYLLEEMRNEMQSSDFSMLPPQEWLEATFTKIVHVQDKYRRPVRLVVQEGHNLGPEGRKMLTDLDREASAIFHAPLEVGMAAGVFRPMDVRFVGHQLLHCAQAWGSKPWAFRSYLTIEAYIKLQMDLMLGGILAGA